MLREITLALFLCLTVSCNKSTSTATGALPITLPATSENPAPESGPRQTTPAAEAIEFNGLGVIREFGVTDTAAMFILKASSGSLVISTVKEPRYLGTARVGTLDQTAMDHLFIQSSLPMSLEEKQSLVAKWSGAQAIYFEGYRGFLCDSFETQNEVTTTGTINGKPFTTSFLFIALPNSSGNCAYHSFGILTRK